MAEDIEKERGSIIFYKSFVEAGQTIKNKNERLNFYEAIFFYAFENKETILSGSAKGMFSLVKPQITANNKRYENGKKGGRKHEPKQNQTQTETEPTINQDEIKDEANKNDNVVLECSIIIDNDNSNENDIITEPTVSVEDEKKYFKKFVSIWFEFHEDKYKFKPAFKAVDGKKINSLIKKLETLSKERQFEFTDKVAEDGFLKLLTLAYSDDWLKSNFELSNIDSKFNSIIQKSTNNAQPKLTEIQKRRAEIEQELANRTE